MTYKIKTREQAAFSTLKVSTNFVLSAFLSVWHHGTCNLIASDFIFFNRHEFFPLNCVLDFCL